MVGSQLVGNGEGLWAERNAISIVGSCGFNGRDQIDGLSLWRTNALERRLMFLQCNRGVWSHEKGEETRGLKI